MNYTIRKSIESDLPKLVEMARISFLQAFTAGNKLENVKAYMQEAFTLQNMREEMVNPASTFFIAEIEDEIVGYCKVNRVPAQTDVHDPESLEISRLYVLQDYLGLGLGVQLLERAFDFGRENQLKYIWLGVWENNARAIRFYEKNGLTKFGEHPFPFGDEIQTDWLMKKEL